MLTNEWALTGSAASLLLSLLALWRTARFKALELRTQLRKDVAELRVTMDELAGGINRALYSNSERSSDSGALMALRREADADSAQLAALRGRLNAINVVTPWCSYKTLETKCAVAVAIRTRIGQLVHKYAGAAFASSQSSGQSPDSVAWRAATTRQ